MVGYVLLSIAVSGITSVVVTRIEATRYFKVIDSYAKGIIELAKKHIKDAYINRGKQ